MRRAPLRLLGLGLALALAIRPSVGVDRRIPDDRPALRDLYFGEALYHAYQGRFFEALERLDTELAQYHGLDEPRLDTLHYHVNEAEFSVGDFELDYRMHLRAGRAIKAVLEAAVDESVRNEAAFRLARIQFQKGQLDDARESLQRIHGTVPEKVRGEVEFLQANLDMATGRPAEAVMALREIRNDESLAGFAAYNLGIALLQDGRQKDAIEQLDRAGTLPATDEAGESVRDKANLVLGAILFDAGEFDRARTSLDRVRLEGAFSNQALLRAGWSEANGRHYDRALVPWNLLAEREPTDLAVQEAMLAVPGAYAHLNLHGRAALLYGRALEAFGGQISRVDASLASVREGMFLKALVREESRQDDTWVIRLRSLPGAPETYYLMELMASHDFQTALHNYLDLEDLREKLLGWQTSLVAYDDLLRVRAANYEPLLPDVDARFRVLDSRMRLRLEQRRSLGERLQKLLTSPQPQLLATADERVALEQLAAIEKKLGSSKKPDAQTVRARIARLRGVISWRLETEYHARLTDAFAHLKELNGDVEELTRRYDAFVRTRQAATHSYVGYSEPFASLRGRAAEAIERVDSLMAQQGRLIENVAIHQLEARRERLVQQQAQARFAVADSYDRAARAQPAAVPPHPAEEKQ